MTHEKGLCVYISISTCIDVMHNFKVSDSHNDVQHADGREKVTLPNSN